MNNHANTILDKYGHYICNPKNATSIVDELLSCLEEFLDKDTLDKSIEYFLENDLNGVLQRTISCLLLKERSEESTNKLPFGGVGMVRYYLEVKTNEQLSLFHDNKFHEIRRLIRFIYRYDFNDKSIDNTNFIDYIYELLRKKSSDVITFLTAYSYALYHFSVNKDIKKRLEIANKLFELEATLYLLEVIDLFKKKTSMDELTFFDKKECFWIMHKNQVLSQEGIEMDELVDERIEKIRMENKSKQLDTFLDFAFNKYDDLYKALS